MSAQFLQSNIPAENQTIRVNSAIIRGDAVISGVTQCETGIVAKNIAFSTSGATGKITLPALGNHQQLTSASTNVGITGDAEQFMITTYESSAGVGGDIAAGATVNFTVFHTGVVAGKTMILCSKAGSYNGLVNVTDYVASTSANQFTVSRHNHGAGTASGNQQLIFKLIQSA